MEGLESIQGKRAFAIDAAALAARTAGYRDILIDIGTGDGRWVRHVARTRPGWFALGVDACREGLRDASRAAPPNALYVIANALALPPELHGLATALTLNFPWGSLLAGLLAGEAALLDGLRAVARPGAILEVRLNSGALVEAGWPLEAGAGRVCGALRVAGFAVARPVALDAAALRGCPSTWARRLAHGRDPRGVLLRAVRAGPGRSTRWREGARRPAVAALPRPRRLQRGQVEARAFAVSVVSVHALYSPHRT